MSRGTTPKKETRGFGFVTIRRRADGTVSAYRAGYRAPDGSGRVVRDFRNRRDADRWLEHEEELVRAHNAGIRAWTHPSRRHAGPDPTFHEWAWNWYREHAETKPDGTPLAPATIRKKNLAMRRLDRRFGRREIAGITVDDIRRLLDEGYGSRMATREAYLLLRAIMRDAEQPADGTPPVIRHTPCVLPVPPKPRRTNREPVATPAQIEELRCAMPEYTRIAINVIVAFGLRVAEVCALRVCDFDLDARILHIRHSARRAPGDRGQYRLGDTKTPGSSADMPIPEALVAPLTAHIIQFCDDTPDAMLLRPPRGGRVMNPNTLRNQFEKAREGIGRPDLRLHTLRATMITETVRQGAEPKETQILGRHADEKTSMRYYQQAHGEQRRRDIADMSYRTLMGGDADERVLTLEIDRKLGELRRLQDEIERLTARRARLRAARADGRARGDA